MNTSRTFASFVVAVTLLGGAAGCSSGGSEGASSTSGTATSAPASSTSPGGSTTSTGSSTPKSPTTQPVTTTSGGTTTTTAESPPSTKACTEGPGRPAGTPVKSVVDVDGDGKRDQAWIQEKASGKVLFGIATDAGGGAAVPFEPASPVKRSALVANADEKGPVEIFLDDGRSVQLYAWVDCAIKPVRNPQGKTYTFSLGFTDVGTGVGCIDTPKGRRLAGLNRKSESDKVVKWSSTVVELDGLHARNGTVRKGTYRLPKDKAKAELLNRVTCGNLTMSGNGVTARQP